MFDDNLTTRCALDSVKRWRGRVAVDVGVASDVCAPRLAEGRGGGHEESGGELLTLVVSAVWVVVFLGSRLGFAACESDGWGWRKIVAVLM